jgi:hypothetical protein
LREAASFRAGGHRPSLIAAIAGGLRDVVARPGAVLALLAANLLIAIALAAPLAALLASDLDHNLYGDAMAEGASWRWFDTVDRRHPAVLGDLSAWNALFGEEGVRLDDLAKLSGVPLAVALAGLAVYWLNALLHAGWLAALGSGAAGPAGAGPVGPAPARGAAAATFAGAARFALPATLIALLAAAFYAGAYALLYVGLGALLDGAGEASQREWVSLGLMWMRLALVLVAFLGIKLWSDLAKAALVERAASRGNGLAALPGALLAAAAQLLRRGPVYATAYLAIGLGTPLLAALWWVVTLPLEPATLWPLLVVLVLAQQLFLAFRIALRLAHLAATRRLFTGGAG